MAQAAQISTSVTHEDPAASPSALVPQTIAQPTSEAWRALGRCLEDGRLTPPRSAPDLAPEEVASLPLEDRWKVSQARAFDRLTASAYASNTLRSYGSHVRAWGNWCRERGVEPLPLDPMEVVTFLMAYAFETDARGEFVDKEGDLVPVRAASSVTSRLSALRKLASFAGVPDPGASEDVQVVMRGIRRRVGVAPLRQRSAIDLALLRRFVNAIDGRDARAARNSLIVALRALWGLSAADLAVLSWLDVAVDDTWVEVRTSSNVRRASTIGGHLEAAVTAALQDARALAKERNALDGTVFTGPHGRPLTRQAVFEAAKVTLAGAHVLVTWADLPDVPADVLTPLWGATSGGREVARARNRAVLTVGWHGALRRSEIVGLNWRDVRETSPGVWTVSIRFSKSDQEGSGQQVRIAQVPEGVPIPCAIRALQEWRRVLTETVGRPPSDEEPIFPTLTPAGSPKQARNRLRRLDGEDVNALIRRLAVQAGLVDSQSSHNFGGHSLRAGFVTEALRDDKVPVALVQEQSRHKNVSTLLRYRREANADRQNASVALMDHFGGEPIPTQTRALNLQAHRPREGSQPR